MTAGFYDVSGTTWGKYRRPGEGIVCDNCMHNDPKYRKDYNLPL